LNANLKAYAAWWLWARLGGWAGPGGEGEGEGEGEFTFESVPHGGWFEEGASLLLSVEVSGTVGAVTYQWIKDGVDLPDETSEEFVKESLVLEDGGWYSCRVTDESKASRETDPAHVQVFAAGSLPAAGAAATAAALAGCIAVGWLVLARRKTAAR
jgi:hypothetical protein